MKIIMSEVNYNKEELYNTPVITIYTEANPNPNSMKFMLNFMLIKDGGSIDFPEAEIPVMKTVFAIALST